MERMWPGIFGLWYFHGPASQQDRKTCLRLLGQEVVPAMREMANEFDLPSPFERKVGSRPLPTSGKREAVVGEAKAA